LFSTSISPIFHKAFGIGFGDVSWNNLQAFTPTLDYLARTGIILDHHYSSEVCSPSRASLMTG